MTQDGRGTAQLPESRAEARPVWPDGVVYHGARFLLLVALAVAITLLFPPMGRPADVGLALGDVVPVDQHAQVRFRVPKSSEELGRERDDAAAGVPPTLDHRPDVADSVSARLTLFFERLDTLAAGQDSAAVRSVLQSVSVPASQAQVALLLNDDERRRLRATALRAIRELLAPGVVDATQAQALTADNVNIRDPGAERRQVPRGDILTSSEFYDRAVNLLSSANPDLIGLLRLIIISHTEFTYVLNEPATAGDRDAVREAVPRFKASFVLGQILVRAGEVLRAQDLEVLNAHAAVLVDQGRRAEAGLRFGAMAGAAALALMLLGVYGALVFFFRPEVYENYKWLLLQAMLVMTYFGAARIIATSVNLPTEALPVALVALAVAVLWDSRMALVLGLVLALITATLPELQGPDVLYPTAVGAAAAAMSVRAVRRRAQTWVFIAIITLAYTGVIVALGLVGGHSAKEMGISILWAGANAMFSGMIAMGFIPVFEWFSGITTDQTLLEWADPNRALLQRLALEAPGSYAHTINVANLGEMAANSIGAHGLLCRVGLYYHDIGKMVKPHYFVENQSPGRNPHDKLKAHTSASIVREHVTEGYRLAKEGGVPDLIADFITQHHGTQLIAYFYDRAKEEEPDGEILEEDFRYPGPRPQTRETAIAMLADSVESATRVLQDPTPERLRDLIDNIVAGKVNDGQLDEAPLTLQEIAQLKYQFAKVLGGIHHHRIDYPTTKHLTDAASPDAQGVGDA